MTSIVAGTFESTSGVDAAVDTLKRAGFRDDELQSFFVGPPGRHDLHAGGGDAHHDEGTKRSGRAALWGVWIGAGIGLAIAVILALVFPNFWLPALLAGVGIGAYAGSLIGALRAARAGNEGRASREEPVERVGGMTLAVNAERPGGAPMALAVLRRHGARDIVQTHGEWRNGQWRDFDPRVPAPRIDTSSGAFGVRSLRR